MMPPVSKKLTVSPFSRASKRHLGWLASPHQAFGAKAGKEVAISGQSQGLPRRRGCQEDQFTRATQSAIDRQVHLVSSFNAPIPTISLCGEELLGLERHEAARPKAQEESHLYGVHQKNIGGRVEGVDTSCALEGHVVICSSSSGLRLQHLTCCSIFSCLLHVLARHHCHSSSCTEDRAFWSGLKHLAFACA